MNLATFQELMQTAILSENCEVLACIDETSDLDRFERLKVYVNAYRLRHASFVANDYPILREVMGDESFERLALDFIAHHPSRVVNARWYAQRLPDFMARESQSSLSTGDADLARLERALADAFDAADAPIVPPASLLESDPESAHQLTFRLHPSVSLQTLQRGTRDNFLAASTGSGLTACGEGEEFVVVWRREQNCFHREIDQAEARALASAIKGDCFGVICAALDQDDQVEWAGNYLIQWFGDGLISKVTVK